MSALPKINATPKHQLVIPSTKKTIMFRPYLVKEEKILLMAFESKDEQTSMRAMLDTIDACCEGDYIKDELTTFDIEYMFTQIRGKSVGESIDVGVKCSECDTQNQININLADINIDVPEVETTLELTDDISLELKFPSFKTFADKYKQGISESEFSFIIIKECIAAVINGEERISLNDVPEKEVEDFVDSLSSGQLETLGKFVEKIPTMQKDVEFDCKNCNHHNNIRLSGIQDFFT